MATDGGFVLKSHHQQVGERCLLCRHLGTWRCSLLKGVQSRAAYPATNSSASLPFYNLPFRGLSPAAWSLVS